MAEGKEEQIMSYMDGGRQRKNEEDTYAETPLIKPSGLMRFIHYHKNSMGETTHDSNCLLLGLSHNMWEL